MEGYDLLLRAGVRSITSHVEKIVEHSRIPLTFKLSDNYPNPFNSGTFVNWTVYEPGDYTVRIVNSAGTVVRVMQQSFQPSGGKTLYWDGADNRGLALPSGVYFLQVHNDKESRIMRMSLVR